MLNGRWKNQEKKRSCTKSTKGKCNLLNRKCLSLKSLKLSSLSFLHHKDIGFLNFIPSVMDPPPPADESQPPGPPGLVYNTPLTSWYDFFLSLITLQSWKGYNRPKMFFLIPSLWFLCCCGLFTGCFPSLLPRPPPPPLWSLQAYNWRSIFFSYHFIWHKRCRVSKSMMNKNCSTMLHSDLVQVLSNKMQWILLQKLKY